MNVVKKAFHACRVLGSVNTCKNLQQISVEAQDGVTITPEPDTDPASQVCFHVDAGTGFNGCWDSDNLKNKFGVRKGTSCGSFKTIEPTTGNFKCEVGDGNGCTAGSQNGVVCTGTINNNIDTQCSSGTCQ